MGAGIHIIEDMNNAPIGIFDSGLGGLTILKALRRTLPHEKLIYFGDTANVPYGSKSKQTVTQFSLDIARFLEQKGVKLIILSAVYYFLIHPRIENALVWLSNNLAFSFIIGFFYGVFVIDLVNATALLVKIKRFADEKQIVVKYEQLREHIRISREKRLEKAKFLMSMGPQSAMAEQLKQYYDKFRDELERSKKGARKTDRGDEK